MTARALAAWVAVTAIAVFGGGALISAQGGLGTFAGLVGSQTVSLSPEPVAMSDVAMAGDMAVWLEQSGPGSGSTANLVRHDVTTGIQIHSDVPDLSGVDPADPLSWLTGGPDADTCPGSVAGKNVCVAFAGVSGGQGRLWTLSSSGIKSHDGDIRARPSVAGDYAVWAEWQGDQADIYGWPIQGRGVPVEALVTGPEHQDLPVVSKGADGMPRWLAWLRGAPDAPTRELWVRDLSDGTDHMASATVWPVPMAASGDLITFVSPDPDGSGAARLMVYDAALREGGPLATRSAEACPGCRPDEFLHADVSDEVIVHNDPAFVRRPGGPSVGLPEVPMLAHDVRAISSYTDLESYLTGYAVATFVTDAASPSASGSRVGWSETGAAPGPGQELSEARLVHVARTVLYLPVAGEK